MEEADIHMDAEIWGTPPDQVQLPLIRRNSLLFHQSKDDWMAHLNEYVLLVLIPVDLDRFPDRDAALIRCRLIFLSVVVRVIIQIRENSFRLASG